MSPSGQEAKLSDHFQKQLQSRLNQYVQKCIPNRSETSQNQITQKLVTNFKTQLQQQVSTFIDNFY